MFKVIVLVGILFLYFMIKLYDSGEIEPNIYLIRLCRTNKNAWSNINDTFLVKNSSSQNILVNLSDSNVTYRPMYEQLSDLIKDSNIKYYNNEYEVTLEEAMKIKICFKFSFKSNSIFLVVGWTIS